MILQLAVQGKLVPQNPKDEPASVLLEKIAAEKERLVKEGKIRKSKAMPAIKDDEMPYELPKGWEWGRLGDVAIKLTDGTHHSPPNHNDGKYKYITAKNIKTNGINLNNITYVSAEIHNSIFDRCNPEYGDLLYIKDGATTGIVTINNLKEPFSMLSSVALIKLPQNLFNQCARYFLQSPDKITYGLQPSDGSGGGGDNGGVGP